jgi:phage gp36-like protein
MPNPLAIELHASGAVTATGVGTAVDLTDRSLVQLTINVTAITGTATPTITLTIEHSIAQNEWVLLGAVEAITVASTKTVTLTAAYRYVRARWTISGTTPSVTFAINGTAHQLYCEPSDITRFGIPKPAVAQVSVEALADKCLSASEEAAGYLASAYAMPMVSWGTDLRRHVACMATYDLMRFIGYDPDSGKDNLIRIGRDDAIAWLNRIAAGKLRPPLMIDSEPDVLEPEVWVASGTSRGWNV